MMLPKFHAFPAWPDVHPGDVVTSPEARFYRLSDFIDRDESAEDIITKHRPMPALARIDGSVDGKRLEPHCSTSVTVMSHDHGRRGAAP